MPDGEYLTPAEFAALTVDQQCDVWAAADAGTVKWVELRNGNPRLYHREQVRALLGEVPRG